MIRKKLLLIVPALAAAVALPSCTNEEEGYTVASRSQLKLELVPEHRPQDNAAATSAITAIGGCDKIFVKTLAADWKVEIDPEGRGDEGDWSLQIDQVNKDGENSWFSFTSSSNRGAKDRTWRRAFVVYVEDPNGDRLLEDVINVWQNFSDIYVSNTSFETFPPAGGGGQLTVTSETEWTLECYDAYSADNVGGWVVVNVGEKDASNNAVVTFTVNPNYGTSPRNTALRFYDASGSSVASVNINQAQSTSVFQVGLQSGADKDMSGKYPVSKEETELSLSVVSDGRWRVTCAQAEGTGAFVTGDQISTQGRPVDFAAATDGSSFVRVRLAANTDREEARVATLVFTRVDDGDKVNPVNVEIIQAGTAAPSVSAPWVYGFPSSKYAELRARYYSDNVSESWINIRKAGASAYTAIPAAKVGNGVVQVALTAHGSGFDYEAGVEYEMQTVVRTPNGEFASAVSTFTSPEDVPAFSTPWVASASQREAVLQARVYSDNIADAGVEIRVRDTGNFTYLPGRYADGVVEVTLTKGAADFDYQGGVEYEVRTRVVTDRGAVHTSGSEPFTSPGVHPSGSDNPNPGLN